MSGERKFLLMFCLGALLLSVSCAAQTNSQTVINSTANQHKSDQTGNANEVKILNMRPLSSEENAKDDAEIQVATQIAETKENEKQAAGFGQIDFKNFTFPIKRGYPGKSFLIKLKDGVYKNYDENKQIGGDTFEIESVDFADVDGDGKKEAVVFLWTLQCGVSCDGGSSLIYIYKMRRNKPALIWRVEAGSLAYGGGLKSFALNKSEMILELFNDSYIRGVEVEAKDFDDCRMKFCATKFTRLNLQFDGQTFIQKERTAFPFPEKTAMNYHAEIKIE